MKGAGDGEIEAPEDARRGSSLTITGEAWGKAKLESRGSTFGDARGEMVEGVR